MMLLTLGLTFLALHAEGRALRSSCSTDLTTFCSGLGNRAYADPCDATCNAYIECWNGGVGVKATCPPTAPMFNPTKLVSLLRLSTRSSSNANTHQGCLLSHT